MHCRHFSHLDERHAGESVAAAAATLIGAVIAIRSLRSRDTASSANVQ
jgi:hypothetical protein